MSSLSSQNGVHGSFETLFSNLAVPSGLVCKQYQKDTDRMCSVNVCDTLVVPLHLFNSVFDKAVLEPKHNKSRKNQRVNNNNNNNKNKKGKTTRKKKTE